MNWTDYYLYVHSGGTLRLSVVKPEGLCSYKTMSIADSLGTPVVTSVSIPSDYDTWTDERLVNEIEGLFFRQLHEENTKSPA